MQGPAVVQGASSSQGRGVSPQGGLPHNAHLHITYSAGLQALQLGKYSTALRCFQVSVSNLLSPFRWIDLLHNQACSCMD